MEAPPAAAGEPAAWAAEAAFADPELGSDELEAAAGGSLDRVLLESVCQQQGWVRVYGEGALGGREGRGPLPAAGWERGGKLPGPNFLFLLPSLPLLKLPVPRVSLPPHPPPRSRPGLRIPGIPG